MLNGPVTDANSVWSMGIVAINSTKLQRTGVGIILARTGTRFVPAAKAGFLRVLGLKFWSAKRISQSGFIKKTLMLGTKTHYIQ